jgi:hypothetical protein
VLLFCFSLAILKLRNYINVDWLERPVRS